MSTETPDTRPEPVAATPPTPENVAEMLTSSDNDYHDGNYWHPSISAHGNVVSIGITAYADEGEKLPEVHFTTVVVEGETAPIVLQRPASLEREWSTDDLLRSSLHRDGVFIDWSQSDGVYLTPDEARREGVRLIALAEAAQAEQGGAE